LAPFIDLFNHKYNAPVRSGFSRRGTFEVIVEAPVKKGEQIFIEYGEQKDNLDLLVLYGFTLPIGENASDKIQVTLDDVLYAAADFPNVRQCSRLATTNTAVSNWHIYASHVDQDLLNALLIFACGDECDIEETFVKYRNVKLEEGSSKCQGELFNRQCFLLNQIIQTKKNEIDKLKSETLNGPTGKRTARREIIEDVWNSHLYIYNSMLDKISENYSMPLSCVWLETDADKESISEDRSARRKKWKEEADSIRSKNKCSNFDDLAKADDIDMAEFRKQWRESAKTIRQELASDENILVS